MAVAVVMCGSAGLGRAIVRELGPVELWINCLITAVHGEFLSQVDTPALDTPSTAG